jgi:hypothetical protein
VSAAQPQKQSRADVDELLMLRDPRHPTRRLPTLIRRLMPDPLRSFEDWQRFTGEDLADTTPADKAWEALRIRTAAALVDDPDRIPAWVYRRLAELAA